MKNQLIKLINLSCCSILALNSCATKDVNANIDHVASKIKNIKESAEKTNSIVNHNFITTVPEGIFTSQVTKDRHSTQLLQIFYSTIKVNNTFTGLKSAGDAISDLTGISVDVASADSKRDTATKSVYIYQNSGNLVNLLDKISTKYDVEWTYNDGVIEFNRLQTYTWSINAIPGDYSMQNNITNIVGLNATNANTSSSTGSGSSSSSGGGNSSSQTGTSQGTQTLAFNSSANIWSNISSTVKSMLSSEGSVSVSPADSTLTVNDRPHVVRLVGRYIAKENEIIGRQVKLEVKLLTVSVSDEDNYNINWAAVLHGTTAGAAIASTAGSTLGSSFTINANSGDLSG